MALLYSHKQFGRAMFFIAIGVGLLVACLAGFLVLTAGAAVRGAAFWLPMILAAVVVLAVLFGFSSLCVTVTDERVSWQFGPGLLRFSTPVREIVQAERAHPSWVYGIGIRITPRGWLYNVASGNAVAITTAKKTVLVGTDDPDGLMRAIEAARGQATPPA